MIAGIIKLTIALCATIMQAAPPALERFEFQQPHMGTNVRIVLYAPDQNVAQNAAQAAFARIAQLDAVYSDYREDSDLTQFCRQAGKGPVRISPDLFQILTIAKDWSVKTRGVFDVTAAPVIQLWRRARRTRQLPDPARLEEARNLTDYRRLRLDPRKRTAELQKAGMRIDLGGIAKGYAADQALAVLAKQGIDRALVALGGDIAIGQAPPQSPGWPIGVAPLDNPNLPPTVFLWLEHAAVSTSGDAEQYVIIDGVRYSHIVDPRTGLGVTGHSNTTVVARRGVTADLLATTLSILGPVEGLRLLDSLAGYDSTLAARYVDGRQEVVSRNWKSKLK